MIEPLGSLNMCDICLFSNHTPKRLRFDGRVQRRCNYCKQTRMVSVFAFDVGWIKTAYVRST